MRPTVARPRPLQKFGMRLLPVLMSLALLCSSGTAAFAFPINRVGAYNSEGVNIRTGPGTSYTSLGLGYTSHSLCAYAFVSGENVNGNHGWIYHLNTTTGVGPGYSSSWYLGWFTDQPC